MSRFNRFRTWLSMLVVSLLVVASMTGQVANADDTTDPPGRLSILLTNDDGYDSAGILALEQALTAAGHRVTIVAPLGQRSGSGMQVTLGRLPLVEQRQGVWSLDGSPADAVSVGLKAVMHDARPDLVVAGANFGQNIGNTVMMSGTVGAAMMAVLAGVPAIAVSVGIDLAEARAEPVHFPSTVAAFPAAAALTARLVEQMNGAGLAALGAAQAMLNVNFPVNATATSQLHWAPVSRHGGFSLVYPERDAEGIRSWIEIDPAGIADSGHDTALFAAGQVTMSILRPDWNAAPAPAAVQDSLAAIAATIE